MLHTTTVYPKTLGLLKKLMLLPALERFNLAGGTALALQIGHRISVDLDFFGDVEFDPIDILDSIRDVGSTNIINQSRAILILNTDGIKIDFVRYRYPLLNPVNLLEDIRLLSILDIGAMKLAAITNRGRQRDFFDLFFILRLYPLRDILDAYNAKFSDGSEFLVRKSLIYFEDAEEDDLPAVFDASVTWPLVKKVIETEVKKL
jgi:predicted nucleotidyltransferase component of viral defense system